MNSNKNIAQKDAIKFSNISSNQINEEKKKQGKTRQKI
jgi:hypothetical protein